MKKVLKVLMLLVLSFSLALSPVNFVKADTGSKITQEDMIYFVFTDRFNDGDTSNDQGVNKGDLGAYHGGDFQGIIDKLDYIKGLGFTAIWISPVVENQVRGYHGYWAIDYYKTNEHFGSMEKLKELVSKAHSKGIKVIFDLVVNHTGQLHPFVTDRQHEGWFHPKKNISNYNNQKEVEENWLAALPDFDQSNPEVRKYLIDMAKWWIKETGIDGYRLDTVRHVSKDFWEGFSREIKKDYPDFFLIGEVYNGDINYVADYQKTGIDGLVDFPMYYKINDVFRGSASAAKLGDAIAQTGTYTNRYLMGTFIDNHDVPRFVNGLYDNKEDRLKSALAFEFTYTGIPVMYYGTEIGMEGGADPDNRRDMDFTKTSSVTDYVKKLAEIRKENKALIYGDIKVIVSDKDILSYVRKSGNNLILAVINFSKDKKDIKLSVADTIGNKGLLNNLLSVKGEELNIKNGTVKLNIEPLSAGIYKLDTTKSGGFSFGVIAAALSIAGAVIVLIIILKKRYTV